MAVTRHQEVTLARTKPAATVNNHKNGIKKRETSNKFRVFFVILQADNDLTREEYGYNNRKTTQHAPHELLPEHGEGHGRQPETGTGINYHR